MGFGCDSGGRPAQTDGYFRKGNADPHYWKIDIYGQERQAMATERLRFVGASRDTRLEERTDGAHLIGQP